MTFDPYYIWLGIPNDEQPPDHYRLLGIRRFEDNSEVISHAAEKQMRHVRSFQLGERVAYSQQILNEISAARICLLDNGKKRGYDQQLRDQERSNSPPVSPSVLLPPATQPRESQVSGRRVIRRSPRTQSQLVLLAVALAVLVAGLGVVVMLFWPVSDREVGQDRAMVEEPTTAQGKSIMPSSDIEPEQPPSIVTRGGITNIKFTSPDVLDSFVQHHGTVCQVKDGEVLLSNGGLIYGVYYSGISSVTIRGRIVLPNQHNFRFSVGPINAILNWERKAENHFRNATSATPSQSLQSSPNAFVPGQLHEIRVRQEGGLVVVTIDDVEHYRTEASLYGTVTIYSAWTIAIQEIEIDGEPTDTTVEKESHRLW